MCEFLRHTGYERPFKGETAAIKLLIMFTQNSCQRIISFAREELAMLSSCAINSLIAVTCPMSKSGEVSVFD